MVKAPKTSMSSFYCTQCGSEGIPIQRPVGNEREKGHLKKLYCLCCKKETNFVEIRTNNYKYTYKDFLNEFLGENFDSNGNRKMPYGQFKGILD